jgi:hypothetical protein
MVGMMRRGRAFAREIAEEGRESPELFAKTVASATGN